MADCEDRRRIAVTSLVTLAKVEFPTRRQNAKEGAETVLFAAVSPEMGDQTGKYLEDSRVYRSSRHSYDESAQDQLHEQTKRMLKPWM